MNEEAKSTAQIPSPMSLVIRAAMFAADRHRDQRRRGPQGAPYINHPIAVAECLVTAGVEDPDVLAAALLHDTVEDTDTSPVEIKELFGPRVSSIVAEVTDNKKLSKAERKRRQIASASTKSYEAKLVKLSDKICNLRDLRDCPPNWSDVRIEAYHEFARDVYRGLRGAHADLDSQMDHLLTQHVHSYDKLCRFD